jgi:hypothetical protein
MYTAMAGNRIGVGKPARFLREDKKREKEKSGQKGEFCHNALQKAIKSYRPPKNSTLFTKKDAVNRISVT